jgi:TetR/AcrR family transcriptional regulator, regulator of cefoperazone and chloramphenicol sensitivity
MRTHTNQHAATALNARRRRDRTGRERLLIRTATKLFADRGYEATTTREIAASASCSEGLIHRYFKGKEGLLLAVMSSHTSDRMLELEEDLPPADSLEEEIRQLMSWEVDRMWQDRNFLRVAVQRVMLDHKVARFVRLVGTAHLAKAIAKRLRQNQKQLGLDDDAIKAASNAISELCFVFGFMRPAVLGYQRRETKRLAENAAKIIARGLQ